MRKLLLPASTSLLFSGSYVAARYTTVDLEPLTASLLRYVVALLFLSALLPRYKAASLKVSARDVPKLVLLGTFGIVGYHFFFFLSLRYTAVANTAIINALSPVVTGILAAVFIRERLSRSSYLGIVASVVGVLLLLTRGSVDNIRELNANVGDLFMLLSVSSWATYALLVKKLSDRYSGFTLTYFATVFGVGLLVVLSMIESPVEQIRTISLASALSIAYMGVFASGLGYLLYNLSIREIGPTRTATFVYSVVPIVVAVLAFLFFAERITSIMALSGLLIVAGLRTTLREEG